MNAIDLRQQIDQKLANLTIEELALVDKLLLDLKLYFQSPSRGRVIQTPPVEDDPLALLRDSDFVGCFSGSPDLAEKSEEIVGEIFNEKYSA
jgi:hypothetical protein